MLPVGFCNMMSPEHASDPPEPCLQPSKPVWSQMAPPESRTSRVFSGQGSMQDLLRDAHPHDRSCWWIYPNLTDPGTSCRLSVSFDARKRRGTTVLRLRTSCEREDPAAEQARLA